MSKTKENYEDFKEKMDIHETNSIEKMIIIADEHGIDRKAAVMSFATSILQIALDTNYSSYKVGEEHE